MQFGLNLANFGFLGDVDVQVELAEAAERAGWDGYFLWDHVNWPGMGPHVDPWITLGVVASRTERLVLGTAVTPMARRRPIKLAREILTLDALSGGRFVFGVGNGILPDEFAHLGDEDSLRVRAEMLDEGLALLQALWADGEVEVTGRHYRVKTRGFGPPASGRRIPIWLAATWPRKRPVERAARFDGILPILDPFTEELTPQHVRDLAAFIAERRGGARGGREGEGAAPFEVVVSLAGAGGALEKDPARVAAFAEAGATWLLDTSFPGVESLEELRARVRRGPPRAA